jgi:hypothetical protein
MEIAYSNYLGHVLDLHDRATNRGELAEPNERIGLQSSLAPQLLRSSSISGVRSI